MTSKQTSRDASPEREHLGWRATSAVPAKKRKLIEGVSGKGVVELQAQLYRAQEQAKLKAEGGVDITDKAFRRKAGIDVASIRNRGVEARDERDKQLQLRTTGEGAERLADSSAALSRKAQLYDRLARGEADENDDKYEVEFWRKGRSHQQEAEEDEWLTHPSSSTAAGPVDTAGQAVAGAGGMMSEDMARERERQEWEEREAALLQQQEEEQQRREARLNAVRELSGQTQAGRAQAAAAKAQREELLAEKRARLKAAFISQQVKAIMNSKASSSSSSSSSKKASRANKASSNEPG